MSDAKRKAAGSAMSPDGERRSTKRQRLADADIETPERTTQQGLIFLNSIKQAKDKTGRPIATEFLSLPSRDLAPQYYAEIRLPIAFDIIEKKLNARQYANITQLESDVKRMVANAKFFNDKRSAVYEDAERIRKTASNWMTKNNPAYRDPGYVAQATPIPGGAENGRLDGGDGGDGDEGMNDDGVASGAVETPTPAPAPAPAVKLTLTNKAKSSTPAPVTSNSTLATMAGGGSKDFVGKTFQQAQDMIMGELIKYTDPESGLEIFQPFVLLPSRSLKDYYEVIRKPVSLTSIRKLANGQHGRNAPTGISSFASWDAFEEEASLVWRNCREYNEDGSDMFLLAGEFEEIFKQRVSEARQVVEEPPQTTIKLKMNAGVQPVPGQSIKLRLNANAGRDVRSPAPLQAGGSARGTPEARSTPGAEHKAIAATATAATMANGLQALSPKNPFVTSRAIGPDSGAGITVPPLTQQIPNLVRGAPAASPPQTANGVKSEGQVGSMAIPPPFGTTPRLHSGSPHPAAVLPQTQPPQHGASGYGAQVPAASTGFDKFRRGRKGAQDAILHSLTLTSHPQLSLPNPIRLSVPAHPRRTTQSVTVSFPPAHHFVQITPHMPVALTGRPYRSFVHVNGARISEAFVGGVGGGVGERDRSRPVYEARLERGVVNRVEVEVLAAKADAAKGGKEEGVEREKFVVFVHLPRA